MRFEGDKPHIVENGSVLRGQYLVVIEAIISTTNARLLFPISTNSLSISTSNGWRNKKISDQEASDDLTHSNGCNELKAICFPFLYFCCVPYYIPAQQQPCDVLIFLPYHLFSHVSFWPSSRHGHENCSSMHCFAFYET